MQGIVQLFGVAYAYEALDLSDDAAHSVTASNLRDSNGEPAKYALVTVSTYTIHFTLDGTAPTAAAGTNVGHPMPAGTSYVIEGYDNIKNFKAINAVAGQDGVVKITFFHRG